MRYSVQCWKQYQHGAELNFGYESCSRNKQTKPTNRKKVAMSVSIYDPASARDLLELRQYIHTTISQTRPVELARRLDVIDGWLDRIVFPNKESFRTELMVARFDVVCDLDGSRIGACVNVLERLLRVLPTVAC